MHIAPRLCDHGRAKYLTKALRCLKRLDPQHVSREMWVLDAGSCQLVFFHEAPGEYGRSKDTRPGHRPWKSSYAILSHTWGTDEVTFEDIQDLAGARRKKGFQKIELACRQARKDGLPYVWIDTCCIDKRSGAELSEAINSMFGWYHRSRVCYAYLSDVEMYGSDDDLGAAKDFPTSSDQIVLENLRRSAWFTRGWTLQELIAPQRVRFFDRHWNDIGTRSTLSQMLVTITGIDLGILQDDIVIATELKRLSVAKRMSWAAGRETSRVEDIAYCLLGLFDISMPLIYGEGRKAWFRLQEAIMQTTTDHSIFLHTSTIGTLAQKPRDFKPGMLGCHDILVPLSTSRFRPLQPGVSGIRVRLPIVTRNEQTYAVFDCRYEGNFTGQVGRAIDQTTDDGPRLGEESSIPLEVEFSRMMLSTFIVCPIEETMQAKCQDLLVVDRTKRHVSNSQGVFQQGISLWFQYDAEFSTKFMHTRAWPEESWRANYSTMNWSFKNACKWAPQPYRAHMLWRTGPQERWLSLSFKVTVLRCSAVTRGRTLVNQKQCTLRLSWHTSEPSINDLEEAFIDDDSANGLSKLDVCLNSRFSWQGVSVTKENNPMTLKACGDSVIEVSMDEQEIMEARVCIVMLRLRQTAH